MSQADEKSTDDKTRPVNAGGVMDNVIPTVSLRNLVISRSLRQTGPLHVSLPQEIPPELQQQWDGLFYALTPEDEDQIHLAARRVARRFFRERYGHE